MSGAAGDASGIRCERHGAVATIWLDRPDKRNAMTYSMWADLETTCVELGADASVRVVVLRGSGNHFCAGADISELLAERSSEVRSFMEVNMAAEHALATLPKPTVAFVEGDCIGGGCALAIDCDVRVGVGPLRMGITPAKLGVVYPGPSLERATRLLGPGPVKYLIFTGRLVDAAQALRIGLIDEAHPVDEGEAALRELCAELAARSLLTQAATKSMVAAVTATGSVPPDLDAAWAQVAAGSTDLSEGVAAFSERRPAVFTWPSRPGA